MGPPFLCLWVFRVFSLPHATVKRGFQFGSQSHSAGRHPCENTQLAMPRSQHLHLALRIAGPSFKLIQHLLEPSRRFSERLQVLSPRIWEHSIVVAPAVGTVPRPARQLSPADHSIKRKCCATEHFVIAVRTACRLSMNNGIYRTTH